MHDNGDEDEDSDNDDKKKSKLLNKPNSMNKKVIKKLTKVKHVVADTDDIKDVEKIDIDNKKMSFKKEATSYRKNLQKYRSSNSSDG